MLSLDQVLCPIDFSETSQHALDTATRLSQRLNLPLKLVHVVMPAPYFAADPEVALALLPNAMLPNDTERAKVARVEIDALAKTLTGNGLNVSTEILMGMPGEVLGRYLASRPGTLTVIGTHGRSAVPRYILGSVAVEIVRQAAGPVMTVREKHADQPIQHVGVAVDFSASCAPAIEFGARLARACGADLHLINIIAPMELLATTEAMVPVQFEAANRVLHESADAELKEMKARLTGLTVHSKVVEAQSYYRALSEQAQQLNLGVLVMGTHGRHGLQRLFLGSVTERTLQVAPCPVVSIRQNEQVSDELTWRDVMKPGSIE